VISVTKVHAGEAYNVTPSQVEMGGTVRTLAPALRDFAERQMQATAQAIARGFGGEIEFKYRRQDPVTFNYTEGTNLAIKAARNLVGPAAVDDKIKPLMISEDFAYLLEARPGAFIFIGNGKSAGLHHPAYEFDDEALPYGIGYWISLVETALGA
jgi:metal-dependent amidase/aminoacylase/carboxypeptidase family protein